MELHAAESIKAERDAYIKAAIRNKVPWPDIVRDYEISLEEVMRLDEAERRRANG